MPRDILDSFQYLEPVYNIYGKVYEMILYDWVYIIGKIFIEFA